MLTNEQRAHDLALYALDDRKESIMRELKESGKPVVVDVYKEYRYLYDLLLEIINRDF